MYHWANKTSTTHFFNNKLYILVLLILNFHPFYTITTRPNTIYDSIQVSAGDDYIQFYQNYISEQKNSNCAMYPSCSEYGRMVVKENNFLNALHLIAERITRCSHDKQFYTTTNFNGIERCWDFPNDSLNNTHNRTFYTDITLNKQKPIAFINHLINCQDYHGAMFEIRKRCFITPVRICINPN